MVHRVTTASPPGAANDCSTPARPGALFPAVMKIILLATLFVVSPALAADPPKAPGKPYELVTLDRKSADADYVIQGEYTGKLGGQKAGVQVVALGGGKFDLVMYQGGLPGDGWSGKKALTDRGNAETVDGKTKLTLAGQTGAIGAGKLTLGADTLERVERKSPTEGAVAPAGGLALFDGTNTDAWEGTGMDAGKLLKEGQNSKQKFQNYSLHIEFMLPYMPAARGQGRGNSGVYNQGRYEVQVLDSFGLEGKDNECGGIYSIKAPDLNMCFPPLQWQTYDIDYTAAKFDDKGKRTANARMTVKHNGVVIHKDVELPKSTTAAPLGDGPEPGPLHLQNHGNPVRFRNIWIVESK
jgi:hypothetical protein